MQLLFCSGCLVTKAENTPSACLKNYVARCTSEIYIIKCGMEMFHHLISRLENIFAFKKYFFVLFSLFCLLYFCLYRIIMNKIL